MLQITPMAQSQTGQAVNLFKQTELRGWFYRLWAKITHQPVHLLDLDDTLGHADLQNSHYGGVHPVPIERIRGSLGKAADFDATFHPVRESSRSRWSGIALEKLRGHDLPPVDLVNVDGTYYVRDGHHRISVARSFGQAYIEAEITMMSIKPRIM